MKRFNEWQRQTGWSWNNIVFAIFNGFALVIAVIFFSYFIIKEIL